MKSIRNELQEKMKVAMKAKNKSTLTSIRLLLANVKNKDIELKREANDDEIVALIQKELKQLEESKLAYAGVGNNQLVKEIEERILLLKGYLPKQLSDEEVKLIIQDAMNINNITQKSQMGELMKVVMPTVKGKCDGKLVNRLVSELLS